VPARRLSVPAANAHEAPASSCKRRGPETARATVARGASLGGAPPRTASSCRRPPLDLGLARRSGV